MVTKNYIMKQTVTWDSIAPLSKNDDMSISRKYNNLYKFSSSFLYGKDLL